MRGGSVLLWHQVRIVFVLPLCLLICACNKAPREELRDQGSAPPAQREEGRDRGSAGRGQSEELRDRGSGAAAPASGEPRDRAAAPPVSSRSTPAADTRPAIVAIGDSITAGFGLDPGNSFTDFLQRQLDGAGLRYRMVNAGISGDTTSGGLDRIGLALAEKPAVVIVELGGNDGLRGFPISVTRSNLEQMIEAAQKAGAKVVLCGMTLPKNYGVEYIGKFETMYKELAAGHKATLIPLPLEAAWRKGFIQPDGLHPTADGQKLLAEEIFAKLKPLL